MITNDLKMKNMRPFASVELERAQLLISSDLRYDTVNVSDDTPLYKIGTVLGEYQTRLLKSGWFL